MAVMKLLPGAVEAMGGAFCDPMLEGFEVECERLKYDFSREES